MSINCKEHNSDEEDNEQYERWLARWSESKFGQADSSEKE